MVEKNIRVRRGDIFFIKDRFVLVWQDDVENEFTQQCACVPIRLETQAGNSSIQVFFEGKPAAVPRDCLSYVPRWKLTNLAGHLDDGALHKIADGHEKLRASVKLRNEAEIQRRGVRRGDVYMASFGIGKDSEQSGVRPALVLSNDRGNFHAPTVIAAAMTSQNKPVLPTHVKTLFRGTENTILLEQIQTLSENRLIQYLGRLPAEVMNEVDRALGVSVGLVPFPHATVPRMDNDRERWFLLKD